MSLHVLSDVLTMLSSISCSVVQYMPILVAQCTVLAQRRQARSNASAGHQLLLGFISQV
jgi:hypothetical protein